MNRSAAQRRTCHAAAVGALAIAVGQASAPAASCEELATPPPAYSSLFVEGPSHPVFGPYGIELKAINDEGVAVGWWNKLSQQPCKWTESGGFEAIPTPPTVLTAIPRAINNNGWIIVNGDTSQGPRAFVLIPDEAGQYTWIAIEPISPVYSQAAAINDKNQVVGLQSVGSPGDPAHPEAGFLWSLESGKMDIQFAGWQSCACRGINDAGIICGDVSQQEQASFTSTTRGFVLADRILAIIEPVAPYTVTSARRVNDQGLVGGTQSVMGGQWQARGYLLDPASGSLEFLAAPRGYVQWALLDLTDAGLALGDARKVAGQGPVEPSLAWAGGGTVLLKSLVSPEIASKMPLGGNALANDGAVVTPTSVLWKCLVHLPERLPCDLDCDGVVGATDLAILLAAWGGSNATCDLNGDAIVDGADLGVLLAAWTSP